MHTVRERLTTKIIYNYFTYLNKFLYRRILERLFTAVRPKIDTSVPVATSIG